MKFVRRLDLTSVTRLWLALEMILSPRWGTVSELARKQGVSRQFLYDKAKRLGRPFEVENNLSRTEHNVFLVRLMLCRRLYGNCPIGGIVRTFREMNWDCGSSGHISECLHTMASACQLERPTGKSVVLLVDETFIHNRPILVVMEAESHNILDITLMTDRKAATWEAALRRLQAAGVDISSLVKDQGGSIKAAAQNLSLREQADLYHLHKPFDRFLPSLEHQAYGAIAQEYKMAHTFEQQKVACLEMALTHYESACAEAQKAIQKSSGYDYLHLCLHKAFDSFTPDGRLRTKTMVHADIEAALCLMEEEFKGHKGILDAVKFLRKNLPDYWNYVEELERIIQRHGMTIPHHTLLAACLAWQFDKKAIAVKNPRSKKEFSRQRQELMEYIFTGANESLKAGIDALFADLNSNIRSSSPLEAINSVIRQNLNACKGQINKESLTMLAFFLNHRKAIRGKYKGTSPYERMTGLNEEASPIELIIRSSSKMNHSKPPDVRCSEPPVDSLAA